MLEKLKNSKYLKWVVPIIVILVFVVRELLIKGIIKGGLINFKKTQEQSNEIEKSIAEEMGRAKELEDQNKKLEDKVNNLKDDEDWYKKR
jgi:cell division protein FtsB